MYPSRAAAKCVALDAKSVAFDAKCRISLSYVMIRCVYFVYLHVTVSRSLGHFDMDTSARCLLKAGMAPKRAPKRR